MSEGMPPPGTPPEGPRPDVTPPTDALKQFQTTSVENANKMFGLPNPNAEADREKTERYAFGTVEVPKARAESFFKPEDYDQIKALSKENLNKQKVEADEGLAAMEQPGFDKATQLFMETFLAQIKAQSPDPNVSLHDALEKYFKNASKE